MDVSRAFRCACGRHAGRVEGEPQSVTWCHCGDCRRESGAPAFAWVGWYEACVTEGLDGLSVRETKPRVTRGRCGSCGSTLAYRDEGLPGLVYIPLGAHDDPDTLVPTEHAYWPEKIAWLSVADDLPKRDATTQERVQRP